MRPCSRRHRDKKLDDRVLVSVLFTIAKSSARQDVITSPDSDVLSVRACRSRLWPSVGLHWPELLEPNCEETSVLGGRSEERARCSSLEQ